MAGLEIFNTTLYSEALQCEQSDIARLFDAKSERGTFHFSVPLPSASKAIFSINFSGKLTNSMMGYYKSSFQNNDVASTYSLTQFEVSFSYFQFMSY